MSVSKGTRPTPQSLPRLTIPEGRRKQEPEEITTTRVDSFLDFCWKHNKAPLTRLPSVDLVLPAPESDSESDSDSSDEKGENAKSKSTTPASDNDLDTLAFTDNEWDLIEAKKADYEYAKAQHTESILELQADPKDRKALNRCKHWRTARELLNSEMSLIWQKREIRRNFRRDANNPRGITNW
ncbi:hypothetical protein F5Y05DRAFT_420188 [Hypoxylon sp. FL0543]|nr:hypothetical protein F5Y05DRAFT_420188 [Hypoxylon sp. FL0543]